MSERIRINGYDTYAPTRTDTITDRKKVRGVKSTTFANDPIKKQKLDLYFDSDRDFLEQIEEMFLNPLFAISKVLNSQLVAQQLLHSYRFNHSIGDIDYIISEAVEFNKYGMILNDIFLDNEQWEYVIDEDFSVANNFPDNGALSYITNSTGNILQEGKNQRYISSPSCLTDTTDSLSGGQGIRGNLNIPFKKYSKYSLETYVRFIDDAPDDIKFWFGTLYIISTSAHFFGYAIVVDAINKVVFIQRQEGASAAVIIHSWDLPPSYDFSNATGNWFKMQIIVIDKTVTILFDNVYIGSLILQDLQHGDLRLQGTHNLFDLLRIKAMPNTVLATPSNSSIVHANQSRAIKNIYGKQTVVYNEKNIEYEHGTGINSVLNLHFNSLGSVLTDKSTENNQILIRNGKWVDGYLNRGVNLSAGDIIVTDNTSLQNLDTGCTITARFKINIQTTVGTGIGSVLIGRGNDWAIYDYNDNGTRKIAFEMNGVLCIGDEIVANEWYEFYFLTEGSSLFIYRRDSAGIPQPEARAWIYSGGSSFVYDGSTYTTDICVNSLGGEISDQNIIIDHLSIVNEFTLPNNNYD